ncbi:hypothetical protein ES703_33883 [subsurface metagenome]
MSDKAGDPTVAHLVEFTIGRLESLPTLACVAAQALHQLFQPQQTPSQLADIIESDPAIAVKALTLIAQQGANLDDENFSIRAAVERLPVPIVREALLSVKVYPPFGQDVHKTVFRKQFLRHCLAVACCARSVTELLYPEINPQLAYYAGLLHDIGVLAGRIRKNLALFNRAKISRSGPYNHRQAVGPEVADARANYAGNLAPSQRYCDDFAKHARSKNRSGGSVG